MNGDEHFHFRLYIDRELARGRQAEEALRSVCSTRLANGSYDIEVVDVRLDPQRAEDDDIIATPTIVRLSPGPARRFIGLPTDVQAWTGILGLD